MLPSMEAFLAIWDDPVEFVEIQCEQKPGMFFSAIVIEAPGIPTLAIKMAPMRTGKA